MRRRSLVYFKFIYIMWTYVLRSNLVDLMVASFHP